MLNLKYFFLRGISDSSQKGFKLHDMEVAMSICPHI